jgi:uncharacterized protein YyaL (SSP411 family)
MHTNRLAREKSPYLQQHAHNPVDWYPWGEEAFEKARFEDKPIFLSIGYSTCHWCHVMERESFENAEVAQVLNRYFVPVKVDREERPDVDRIYMMFVQATTGSGGWPMSVWLTGDLKPFFGGTYFPPDDRYGRPGFKTLLEHLAEAWRDERDKIYQSGSDVVRQLRQYSEVRAGASEWLDPALLDSAYQVFRRSYDPRLGGFGGAPKFPRPVVHNFLFRYFHRAGTAEARDMVLLTLREMAKGGMNDQLGGGFHRYSVDARWFVPHFEKMLYDQAQLALSYVEAYQITGDEQYARVARATLDYVLRDMRAPEGGFYSAEDADSVVDPAKPEVKGEGAFYIWSQSEIEQVAGQPAAEWFCYRYGVEQDGNVHEDPHHEFTGKNILYELHTVADTAMRFERPMEEVSSALEDTGRKLLAARAARVRPHLDDKILTAWNGLMISAFAKAAAVFESVPYLQAADRAAQFILDRMYDSERGLLLRRFREGEAAVPGFLDDYAFFTQALLDLYGADFEPARLDLAVRLAEMQTELFEDRESGAFFSTAAGKGDLILRMKEDYDGAEPSGNSVAALNLLRLAQFTDRADFRQSGERTLRAFAPRMVSGAAGVPQMLVAYLFSLSKPKQVVLTGDRESPDTREFLRALNRRFDPNRIVFLVDGAETRGALAERLPALAGMEALNGKTTAYVCENYACKLPVTEVSAFIELLK